MLIIIQKPNKPLYNTSKIFQPIVLLNMLGKLIEKAISERFQIHSIASNFIYPNQLGDIKQCSIINIGIYLTYLIYIEWINGLHMNILAFNIAQFFPSLNHQLLLKILDKAEFDLKITTFFSSYFNRQTQYLWNNFISPFFRADVGVGQEFAYFPILSALSILHIFEKKFNNPLSSFFVSILSFVYNELVISQKKVAKNLMQISFVVMVLFSFSLTSLD